MPTGSHQLPLPAGVRMAPPGRRSVPTRWAAPDPAALILDPWAPPIGLPIAGAVEWPAPLAHTRIRWMASPPALLPAPVGVTPRASSSADEATQRALATLREISAAPTDVRELTPLPAPKGLPRPTLEAPDPLPPPVSTSSSAPEPRDGDTVRWRLIALVAGVGASAAAVATLIATWL